MSKKHNKDCIDWTPMDDGTKTGDTEYCALSLLCKQIGMKGDFISFINNDTKTTEFDYFCTGMYEKKEEK